MGPVKRRKPAPLKDAGSSLANPNSGELMRRCAPRWIVRVVLVCSWRCSSRGRRCSRIHRRRCGLDMMLVAYVMHVMHNMMVMDRVMSARSGGRRTHSTGIAVAHATSAAAVHPAGPCALVCSRAAPGWWIARGRRIISGRRPLLRLSKLEVALRRRRRRLRCAADQREESCTGQQ